VSSPSALSCAGVTKSYAGVPVLRDFHCEIAPGEVHALLGENGSGKSTFIKILAGVVSPDPGRGSVEIGGKELSFGSPDSGSALGCRFVHQDLGLVGDLSVLDNMLMVAGYVTRFGAIRGRRCLQAVREDLDRIGLKVDPRTLVRDLSPATKTGVAVARAMHPNDDIQPRLLVLDEPTATLPDDEVHRLMEVIRGAQASGIGILYVTHRLDEVFQLGGMVTVLRDGRRITTQPSSELNKRSLITLMAGTELTAELAEDARRSSHSSGAGLVVSGVSGGTVEEATFSVQRGEIVGIAGITGSGREAILPLLYGGVRRDGGDVRVGDVAVTAGRPDRAVRAGMGYLPPDRKTAGGFVDLTVAENATIADLGAFSSALRVNRKEERRQAKEGTERMSVRPDHALALPLSSLSGGNQQKVLFAKWLRLGLQVFLLDEPTQGVDVNAKALLHRQLVAASDAGLATVVASTDVDELAALCDRVLIFRKGRIAVELRDQDVSVAAITHACLESDTEVLV
jgi:ribose transport system ATP-binding protein